MNALVPLTALLAAGLASVHLFAGRVSFLDVTPRSVWLSIAGGISVAYVFVHLLPDLAEEQEAIREAVGESFSFLEYHVYLVALIGLAVFYGLRKDHKGAYERVGRWVLAAGIFVGWVVGVFSEISEAAIAVLFGFLAGGVIMNVLKEELPEEREGRFWAFALGATLYAVVLLVTF